MLSKINVKRTLITSLACLAPIAAISTIQPAVAQGYAGTGMSKEFLENFCQMAALQGATGNTSSRHYVDTTLKGRFAVGNSTMSEYQNQRRWFANNCPAY